MYFHLLSIELHQQQLEHVPLHFLNEYSKVLICRQSYQKQYLRTQFTNCLLLWSGRSAMTAIQLKKTHQKTITPIVFQAAPVKESAESLCWKASTGRVNGCFLRVYQMTKDGSGHAET